MVRGIILHSPLGLHQIDSCPAEERSLPLIVRLYH